MENTDSFAILDINIGDRKDAGTEKTNNNDIDNKRNPFSTVIKIRKLTIYKVQKNKKETETNIIYIIILYHSLKTVKDYALWTNIN